MPEKHPNTRRLGGPGASHENRKQPEKSQPGNLQPADTKSWRHSGISGGGGEHDSHHTHDSASKGGKTVEYRGENLGRTKPDLPEMAHQTSSYPAARESEFAVREGGMNPESYHKKP